LHGKRRGDGVPGRGYKLNHRPKSLLFAEGRLARLREEQETLVLSDLTQERIRGYIRKRQGDGAAGRTINMELGELSRAIGQPWSILWPKVRKLEERKDAGGRYRQRNNRRC